MDTDKMVQMETDLWVDTLTGEIIKDDEGNEIAVEVNKDQLPNVARALRSLARKKAEYEEFMKAEVERVTAACGQRISKIAESMTILQASAEVLMKSADMQKVHYPGLGVFRFGKSAVSVNDTGYINMSDEAKELTQITRPSLFKTTSKVAPVKKEIKAALLAGEPLRGFSLFESVETFVFKPEKGIADENPQD